MRFITKVFVGIGVVAFLAMTACHSSKQVSEAYEPSNAATSAPTPKQVYTSLADSYQKWSDVYMPVSLSMTSPAKLSCSGRATMVRDREIHISLRLLGFELGVVYVNNDSVYALDKFHKYYVAESLSDLLRGADLTVGDMQALLLGQAFLPGHGVISNGDHNDFTLAIEDGEFTMTPKKGSGKIAWRYQGTDQVPALLQSLQVTTSGTASAKCTFTEPTATIAGNVARLVNVQAVVAGKNLGAQVKWDYGSASWDGKRTVKFNIPSGYKRIGAGALLEALKSF